MLLLLLLLCLPLLSRPLLPLFLLALLLLLLLLSLLLLLAPIMDTHRGAEHVATWVLPGACARGMQALVASAEPQGTGSVQGCAKTAWGTFAARQGFRFRVTDIGVMGVCLCYRMACGYKPHWECWRGVGRAWAVGSQGPGQGAGAGAHTCQGQGPQNLENKACLLKVRGPTCGGNPRGWARACACHCGGQGGQQQ